MAYTPTLWADGDLITAERMNKLEQGVANEQIGPAGIPGEAGPIGPQGPAGVGVPEGGEKGQVLCKTGTEDYHTGWADFPSGVVSNEVQRIVFLSQSEYDALTTKETKTLYLIGV